MNLTLFLCLIFEKYGHHENRYCVRIENLRSCLMNLIVFNYLKHRHPFYKKKGETLLIRKEIIKFAIGVDKSPQLP